jgi:hypothetical protein
VKLARWRSDQELAAGLRTKDLNLQSAQVYKAEPSDIVVADVDAGPVILARAGKPKVLVIGFHPVRSEMRYELATPLLFANILRWMSPEVFRRWELNAGTVGTVDIALGSNTDASSVRVAGDSGNPVPFTIQGRTLRVFTPTPETVRVFVEDREIIYSLTLPDVAEGKWEPLQRVRHGIPSFAGTESTSSDLWRVLALLGALCLLLEWWFFGRRRGIFAAARASRPRRNYFHKLSIRKAQ